jgi:hypothetical protein
VLSFCANAKCNLSNSKLGVSTLTVFFFRFQKLVVRFDDTIV